MDCLVLQHVNEQLIQFPKAFVHIPLFVNVVPTTLLDSRFLPWIQSWSRQMQELKASIFLEITEQVPYEAAQLIEVVNTLRNDGIRVGLDDVGQGFSTLEALSVLEPDFIKIDRSLIRNITLFPGKQRMLHLLVDYMGSGHAVVAEGVETQDDLLTIKELRLALSQGYFWSKPLELQHKIDFWKQQL